MKNYIKTITILSLMLVFSAVSNAQPKGFSEVSSENGQQQFTVPTDVAYGAKGKYFYKYHVTGRIAFSNKFFGDPVPNMPKKGYAKSYAFAADEGSSKTFNIPVVAAYGAKGTYVYKTGVSGRVAFTNAFFGSDPKPNVKKGGYYKPFELVSNEGESFFVSGRADVAYGAKGKFIIKRNVTGWVKFDNAFFGSDPTPNIAKKGYVNRL